MRKENMITILFVKCQIIEKKLQETTNFDK